MGTITNITNPLDAPAATLTRYNYTRENKTWEEICDLMRSDVRPDAM
jgi:hypothetical protein